MSDERTIPLPISLIQRIVTHIATRFNDDLQAAVLVADIQRLAQPKPPEPPMEPTP